MQPTRFKYYSETDKKFYHFLMIFNVTPEDRK